MKEKNHNHLTEKENKMEKKLTKQQVKAICNQMELDKSDTELILILFSLGTYVKSKKIAECLGIKKPSREQSTNITDKLKNLIIQFNGIIKKAPGKPLLWSFNHSYFLKQINEAPVKSKKQSKDSKLKEQGFFIAVNNEELLSLYIEDGVKIYKNYAEAEKDAVYLTQSDMEDNYASVTYSILKLVKISSTKTTVKIEMEEDV